MQKLGISEIADNDVNEVSGGQLQRACICRSLINHPRILFADEPTGALNKQSSHEVMEELNRIHKEGTSILLVTHDMKVASPCAVYRGRKYPGRNAAWRMGRLYGYPQAGAQIK